MLPKNLVSSYTRYKHDTDAIASWLATTAKSHGYASESQSKSAKKRAKQRELPLGPPQPQQPTQGRSYTIALKDFTTLADFIAGRDDPRVQVPPRMAALLDRTIRARQYFSFTISSHLEPDDQKFESDDRHAFFLRTLEKVREILKPIYPPMYTPVVEKPMNMDEVINMFDNLQVEEPSDAFENAPDVVLTPSEPATTKDTYNAEREEEDLMECYMAFQFFLFDLHQIRLEVQRSWEGYRQHMIDLVAASITTNTAVHLARAMEDDLNHLLKKQGGAFKMLQDVCAAQNINTRGSHPPGDDMNFRQYKAADYLFWPSAAILEAFCNALTSFGPKGIPEMKKGHFGIYDPKTDRSQLTAKQRHQEDKILLLENLPEFVIHCRARPSPLPVEDELTRGLRAMFETKEITMSTIVATTFFLDIHHILRDEVDYGFKTLLDTANYVRSNVNLNIDFHKDLSLETWPRQNDMVMNGLLEEMKQNIQDDFYRQFSVRAKRMHIPAPYHFYRNHPWLCGLWKYNLLIRYHELSIYFVNAWGATMSCAHLYNALKKENMLQGRWEDFDFVVAMQGTSTFYVGDPPNNPEDYLLRFCTAFGLSAGAKAAAKSNRGKKKGSLLLSKRGPQGLKELGSVWQVFKERYCEPDGRRNFRKEDIDKMLAACDWNIETENGLPTAIEKTTRGRRPPRKSPLLAVLDSVLHAEIPEIAFDYLALHRNCWRLLRELKDSCRDQLIKFYGPEYLEKEEQLPFIVGWILMMASKSKELTSMVKELRSTEVTSKDLLDAAAQVQGMLSCGVGSMVLKTRMPRMGVEIRVEENDD